LRVLSVLLPFAGWLATTIREVSKPFAVCGPSLCAGPRRKEDFVPSPFKLWTGQAALGERAAAERLERAAAERLERAAEGAATPVVAVHWKR